MKMCIFWYKSSAECLPGRNSRLVSRTSRLHLLILSYCLHQSTDQSTASTEILILPPSVDCFCEGPVDCVVDLVDCFALGNFFGYCTACSTALHVLLHFSFENHFVFTWFPFFLFFLKIIFDIWGPRWTIFGTFKLLNRKFYFWLYLAVLAILGQRLTFLDVLEIHVSFILHLDID